MRQFTAVVNPTAGGSQGAATLVPLARALREAGADVRVAYSHGLDHAAELARDAALHGRFVLAVGGDGMAGCVGGALAGSGSPFGIVPAGRGNDFARALRLPSEVPALAELLLHAEPRGADAIEVESAGRERTAVLGSVYAGVDAVANQYANSSRLLTGSASYYLGALRAVLSWRAAGYRVTVDGEAHDFAGYTVVVANSPFYGFGRRIAPGAAVDDGLLDVVVIRDAPRPLFFTVMNELKDGSHLHRPEVELLHGHEIRIEADRALPYGADGEVTATLPLTARVLPGALDILY